jgi:hypothetical protein
MRVTDTTYETAGSAPISNVESISSMSDNPEVAFTDPKPHGGYYFPGGDVVLQVSQPFLAIDKYNRRRKHKTD